MAIGEAMAVGVPVVTANRCGMPYMVSEGVSGYLIDPENTEEIADRLALLLTDSERTQAFGRAARIIAEERFHPAMVARRTRDVYYGLCRKDPHNHSSDSG